MGIAALMRPVCRARGQSGAAVSHEGYGVVTISVACTGIGQSDGGTVINAASASQAHVQAAIDAASPGDTVQIPAGTGTWTSQMSISKGINLIGSGIGVTTIVDDVPKGTPGSNRLMVVNVNSPATFRIAHFTLQGSATDPSRYNQGHIALGGTCKAFRVDHIEFADMQTVGIRLSGDLIGVIDNNTFTGDFQQGVFLSHGSWGGQSYGDGSWAEALSFGTGNAVYIEDNVFTELGAPFAAAALDALSGARVVFRSNLLTDTFIASHGTESGQRERSIRSFEIYDNDIQLTSGNTLDRAIYIRGGTGVIYDNRVTGSWNSLVSMQNFRDTGSYTPWGQCNGSSVYDGNTGGGGYRCVDQPGAGTSNLLSGATPASAPVGNVLDPIYIWDNTGGSYSIGVANSSANVDENRDYYVGTSRPGYTPYTYPHPLRAGD
jgi:hypothetical protein